MRRGAWRLSAWLGAIAMVATACVQQGVRPAATEVEADSADQVLFGMTTTVTVDGVKRSLVTAETAYVYQSRQEYDLKRLNVTFFDAMGAETSSVTALAGTYDMVRDAFVARGDVQWVSADRTKVLKTQRLFYDKNANRIHSDTAFTYQTAGEFVQGNSFESDIEFRNVTIAQPRGRQLKGGALLPGQR